MARYVPVEQRSDSEIREEISRIYEQWNHIAQHGGQDPFWPDGVLMNLLRNHIIYFNRELDRRKSDQRQMSMFEAASTSEQCELPPELPDNLMVLNGTYAHRLDERNISLLWVETVPPIR